jgi:hypothetical protein
MILELNDIEIILRKASDEEKQSIPVWDAYIEKVIIDGNILLPFYGINSLVR